MNVNFKPLNKLVERNHYLMPVVETLIEELEGEEYFSCLDLKDGYFHVRILPGFEKYFAFVTKDGEFEFTRLPFGYARMPQLISVLILDES